MIKPLIIKKTSIFYKKKGFTCIMKYSPIYWKLYPETQHSYFFLLNYFYIKRDLITIIIYRYVYIANDKLIQSF